MTQQLVAKRSMPQALRILGALLQHLGTSTVTAFLTILAMKYVMHKRAPVPRKNENDHDTLSESVVGQNIQRQAAIAWAGPSDHAGNVVSVPNEHFDLDKTIFKTLKGAVQRFATRSKIGNNLYWADGTVDTIQAAYTKIAMPLSLDANILRFMEDKCDFSTEHADGSFMDHLNFCQEYSMAHFKEHSPRVLFLHSIMGVGTNCFPMGKDKVPELKSMITDFEYRHIEAFPSILRLLNDRTFLVDLIANRPRLDKLESLSFHRVIDNEPLTMSAEDLWIHLNYQAIHLIDFLPAACWAAQLSEPLFGTFVELISFLKQTDKLVASINFQQPSGEMTMEGQPLTLGSYVYRFMPDTVSRKLQKKAIRQFSHEIGHSLNYELRWTA